MRTDNNCNNTSFQAYLKFKDTPNKIEQLRTLVHERENKYLSANYIKGKNYSTLEILSGKHKKMFYDQIGKNSNHFELRTNLDKFFGEKPKKANVDKFIKKLDKKA